MCVYGLAILGECYFVPKFLKAAWPGRCKLSLTYKMICSALFMLSAFCCIMFSRNYSYYTVFMMLGLAFGLIGDLLIHYPCEGNTVATCGGTAFAVGHIFYIVAFSVAIKAYFPDARIFNAATVAAIVFFVLLGVAVKFIKKIKFGIYTVPVLMYTVAITTMLSTAIHFTYRTGFSLPVVFTVLLGAVLFVLSDATIALLMFGGHNRNWLLKVFNIVTYFLGQVLLGTSILFVK